MQPVEVKSLGFKLTKATPSSVEEFDTMAKESGAALREAVRNVLYRSTLADFRNSFLHGSDEERDGDTVVRPAIEGLDKITGIERKTKIVKPEVKDEAGKVTQEQVEAWNETEDDYFSRVMAELAVRDGKTAEAVQLEYLEAAQAVLDAIPFDPSKTERKSAGPKKVPATYLEVAKEIVNATGSIENAVAAFERKTGTSGVPVTLEGLAKAVWDDQKAKKKKIAAGYAQA